MAFLFQANPDQWDLRQHLRQGESDRWLVSRYQTLIQPGELVLLWMAKGSQNNAVKGLYGWGITDGSLTQSDTKHRITVRYIERWYHWRNPRNSTQTAWIAPLPASVVLALPSWQESLISVMPVGTNFLLTEEQLNDLAEHIKRQKILPDSQILRAIELAVAGKHLAIEAFTPQECTTEEAQDE